MKPVVNKILTWAVLPAIIVLMAYGIVHSVMKPIKFENARKAREAVAIQRLKDIRTLQTAFKEVTGRYASTLDSVVLFYNTGSIDVDMMVGSQDDSVAVANTKALKKKNPKITPAQMLELSKKGARLVFTVKSKIPVKDTLFRSRQDFCVDSIVMIPFCGQKVQMETVVKQVSGVEVPLFEAKMPYNMLLWGLDRQLIVNLNADREDSGRYAGLMVGSISAPNNNAGNWE